MTVYTLVFARINIGLNGLRIDVEWDNRAPFPVLQIVSYNSTEFTGRLKIGSFQVTIPPGNTTIVDPILLAVLNGERMHLDEELEFDFSSQEFFFPVAT